MVGSRLFYEPRIITAPRKIGAIRPPGGLLPHPARLHRVGIARCAGDGECEVKAENNLLRDENQKLTDKLDRTKEALANATTAIEERDQRDACVKNLRRISGAVDHWVRANNRASYGPGVSQRHLRLPQDGDARLPWRWPVFSRDSRDPSGLHCSWQPRLCTVGMAGVSPTTMLLLRQDA